MQCSQRFGKSEDQADDKMGIRILPDDTILWMWGDASLLGKNTLVGHCIATQNPLRYSVRKNPMDTIAELGRYSEKDAKRPVEVIVERAGKVFKEAHFETVAGAMLALRVQAYTADMTSVKERLQVSLDESLVSGDLERSLAARVAKIQEKMKFRILPDDTILWMWGDASLLGKNTLVGHHIATQNPLRYSVRKNPEKTIADLQRCSEEVAKRHVEVIVERAGNVYEKARFETVADATLALQVQADRGHKLTKGRHDVQKQQKELVDPVVDNVVIDAIKCAAHYPRGDGQFPVLVFIHGGAVPDSSDYSRVIGQLVSAGFVVVANMQDSWNGGIFGGAAYTNRIVTGLNSGVLRDSANTGTIGLVGHSLGGLNVSSWAASGKAAEHHEVKALVTFHGGNKFDNPSGIHMPVLVIGGSNDQVARPSALRTFYQACSSRRKVYIEIKGAGHEAVCDDNADVGEGSAAAVALQAWLHRDSAAEHRLYEKLGEDMDLEKYLRTPDQVAAVDA